MVTKRLKESSIKIFILSRGRSSSIITHKLIPSADVIVPVCEKILYEKKLGKTVLTYPDEIKGLSKLRNYILDTYDEETIIMADDDIFSCKNIEFNLYTPINKPEDILRLLTSTARITKDLGKSVFGYKTTWDIRHYDNTNPFRFNSWIGTLVGIVGRRFRFDEHNMFKVDADYCLQALKEDRIIINDCRYSFMSKQIKNTGGNLSFRTKELIEQEKMYLKCKWGSHIQFNIAHNGERLQLDVPRTIR